MVKLVILVTIFFLNWFLVSCHEGYISGVKPFTVFQFRVDRGHIGHLLAGWKNCGYFRLAFQLCYLFFFRNLNLLMLVIFYFTYFEFMAQLYLINFLRWINSMNIFISSDKNGFTLYFPIFK